VTASGNGKAHHAVTRFGEGGEHAEVGQNPANGSHIGELGVKQGFGKLDAEEFDLVDVLATCVHALSRPSFGIPIAEIHGESFADRRRVNVLRSD
jgi:hypothetical protein